MKYLPFVLLLLLTALSVPSCSIEDRIERREDRLLGTWQIDRATFKGDNSLFPENVTDDFRGDRVVFFNDYSLLFETGNGQVFDGFWAINYIRDRSDDATFTFDADFFDARGRLSFQWLGSIVRLNGNSFDVEVWERGGVLRLKWDRR